METSNQTPAAAPQPQPPAAAASPKKSNPWPWIIGGCLMLVILIAATIFGVGWWGARKIKKEIEKSQPLENLKEGIEKMREESEEWEKKSQEFRESIPNPEDFPSNASGGYDYK